MICHNFRLFSDNCRLTTVRFIQFKNKDFELVVRCLNQWKNSKGLGNNSLYSQSQRFFANVCLNCSNTYTRQMMFGHVAILFSRTPDRDFRCFYPCEIFLSHIPTHTRSIDPCVSSLSEKSVPHRYPCEISVTNTR